MAGILGRNQYRGRVTYPPRRAARPADASVLLGVRGLPSWGAVLVGLIFGAGGLALERAAGWTTVGWGFSVCFTAGILLAVLAVRRGSIFTGMVQAPILLAVLVFVAFKLVAGEGTIFSASKIVTNFPTMAVATGIALLFGLVRIIAQPTRRGHGTSRPGTSRTAARA